MRPRRKKGAQGLWFDSGQAVNERAPVRQWKDWKQIRSKGQEEMTLTVTGERAKTALLSLYE